MCAMLQNTCSVERASRVEILFHPTMINTYMAIKSMMETFRLWKNTSQSIRATTRAKITLRNIIWAMISQLQINVVQFNLWQWMVQPVIWEGGCVLHFPCLLHCLLLHNYPLPLRTKIHSMYLFSLYPSFPPFHLSSLPSPLQTLYSPPLHRTTALSTPSPFFAPSFSPHTTTLPHSLLPRSPHFKITLSSLTPLCHSHFPFNSNSPSLAYILFYSSSHISALPQTLHAETLNFHLSTVIHTPIHIASN